MPGTPAGVRRPVVLVTGVTAGIGRATAAELARRGHRVFGTSRGAGEGPAGVELLTMDVRDDASVGAGVGHLLDRAGRLDAVVNNAGIGTAGPLEDTSIEEAKALFETNVFGVWRVCRAVLPVMREAGGGLVVNVGSMAGLSGTPFCGAYAATKFAVEGFTESLRLEVAPFGIYAVVVEPGNVDTRATLRSPRTDRLTEAYRPAVDRAVEAMVAAEAAGLAPEAVAKLIAGIVATDRPRLRYSIGVPAERPVPLLKRLLPWALYEPIIRRAYRLG